MLNELKKEANRTLTENGAATLRTSGSECLDLFATIGALRSAEEEEIVRRFLRAFAEDRITAMKLLFYGRDIRGGLGERRIFRILLNWLAKEYPDAVRKNLTLISEYGRWDDALVLLDTPCEGDALNLIARQLKEDQKAMENGESVSLLAKWLPSVNTSNKEAVAQAKHIARALGLIDAGYRKMLVALRAYIRILENNLREKDYTFEYAAQPSKAMFKYRKAFRRNDGERYAAYLDGVSRGEAQMHTGTLMPYEIVEKALRCGGNADERRTLDVTWNALENNTDDRNALCVIDGSGSMYGGGDPRPISVAVSLGMYFAERNKGAFRNHFITFSHSPQLVEIKGADLVEKVQYCMSYNEVADTNIQKVFELVLDAAVRNHLPQEELPETLYIITDMEFNSCTRDADITNFEYARELYRRNGYKLPQLVFWNVQSRNAQQPVSMNEQNVVLVSGCTSRLFSMAVSGNLDPYRYMLQVLNSERYAPISA